MISTIRTYARVQDHNAAVDKEIKYLQATLKHITEVRRVQRSWWGLWADEDVTQITYKKGD